MTRAGWLLAVLLLSYFASGWYVVGGDEKAVVRRFGKMDASLRGSGLHYDLPWPWCRVDRVNLAAVRTLTVGDTTTSGEEMMPASLPRTPAYLTGDKNILLLKASVQYRLHEERIAAFLFGQTGVANRLRIIVENALTEHSARCGVDYLHTFGLSELNQRLTRHVQQQALSANLGVEVDQVTLERVEPPARVQAEFLDVSNARAEAARTEHDARTYSEQRVASAAAEADQLRQQAVQQKQSRLAEAQGAAARFERLVSQLETDARGSGRDYESSRAAAMQRMTWDSLRQSLGRTARRVVIDSSQPIDLNVQGGP